MFDHGTQSKNREARENWPEKKGDHFPCVVAASANPISHGAETLYKNILESLKIDYKGFGSKKFPKCAMLGIVLFGRPIDPDDSPWRLTREQYEELVRKKNNKKKDSDSDSSGQQQRKKHSNKKKGKNKDTDSNSSRKSTITKKKKNKKKDYSDLCYWRVLAAWRFLQPIQNSEGHCGLPMSIAKQRDGDKTLQTIRDKMVKNQWVRVL